MKISKAQVTPSEQLSHHHRVWGTGALHVRSSPGDSKEISLRARLSASLRVCPVNKWREKGEQSLGARLPERDIRIKETFH